MRRMHMNCKGGIFALLVMGTLMATAKQMLIVTERNQKPAYTLVCPEKASASQKYAAEEFRDFTEKMTGVRLPIISDKQPLPQRAILLGNTKYTDAILKGTPDWKKLGEDGFRIVARPPHLLILGSPVRGTLYGVYEVLERYGGCRWYSSWHSKIPQIQKLEVPADYDDTQIPAFAMREPLWFDLFNGDFAARLRLNGNAMRLQERHGGRSFRFGGGLGNCHTFNILLDPNVYFDQHPEYFSLVNGKRLKERTQLCLTNPDVLRIVTQHVLERIRKDPGAKFYGVSQNDWHNYCTCPKCKAIDDYEESHAGTMVRFVNAIAEAVEKEFPDVIIETLAYQYTRKPPKYTKLRKNVVPCLCTIECEFSYGIGDSTFPQNISFQRDIEGWSKQTDQLYVWDYTTNFRHYVGPFPNVRALQDNIKFFRKNKVRELFEQGNYQGPHADFAELKGWLIAKWMWNPDLPIEPLLQDFFNGYYGKAAPYVRTYFDALHSFYRDPGKDPLRIYDDMRYIKIPTEFFLRADALWDQAEAAVKDDPASAYNVRMGHFPVKYLLFMRQPLYASRKVWVTRFPEKVEVPRERTVLAKWLLDRMAEKNNIRLSESKLNDVQRKSIEDALKPFVRGKPCESVQVEENLIHLHRIGEWGTCVEDPLAEDGKAMKLFNTHYEWCTTFPLQNAYYENGETYELRVRVRADYDTAKENGEAFWAGIYDPKQKRGMGDISKKCREVGKQYQWFTVARWKPTDDQYFWIGPGRFNLKEGEKSSINALYIDKLEIRRVP